MTNQNDVKDVNAKTVEEAIEQGLAELGVSREQVDVEVLSEGKRGLFGLGAEEATVRLTVKSGSDASPTAKAEVEEIAASVPEETEAVAAGEGQEETPSIEEVPASEPEKSEEDEVVGIARKHLTNLVQLMGVEGTVVTRLGTDLVEPGEEPPIVLDVTGKDLGILIGRRNETLQDLQYMVRLMVSKETGRWHNLVVDVESYRSRRRESLKKMATRMADRAVANDERVVLEAMTAYERRIVHITLRDRSDVYTKSVGRDHNRKVTIIPK